MAGLYHPRWTKTIEAEFLKNFAAVVLARTKAEAKVLASSPPTADHFAKARHRLACFRSAAGPQFEVLLYNNPEYVAKVPEKVDPKDVHVASAALVLHTLIQEEGTADKVYIVSSNITDLAVSDMRAIGVHVVSPGKFIDHLNAVAPARVEQALLQSVKDLKKEPAYTLEHLLGLLQLHKASATASYYSRKWEVTIPHSRVR